MRFCLRSLVVASPVDRLHLIEADAKRGADMPIIDVAPYYCVEALEKEGSLDSTVSYF